MKPHDFVPCTLTPDECTWQNECHYSEGDFIDCLVHISRHEQVNRARAHGLRHHAPSANPKCTSCSRFLKPEEVKVFADSSSRGGLAIEPYHLGCYLSTTSLDADENAALRDYVYSTLTDALSEYE